uniref:Uncharacterized protein n=1 Tax=Anguilla anguilla TaxID=7936 RepID=A0A0E9Y1C0_ANGAN
MKLKSSAKMARLQATGHATTITHSSKNTTGALLLSTISLMLSKDHHGFILLDLDLYFWTSLFLLVYHF